MLASLSALPLSPLGKLSEQADAFLPIPLWLVPLPVLMPDLQSLMNLLLSQFIALFAGNRDLVSESGVGLSSPLWCLMQTPLGARGGSCFQEAVAHFEMCFVCSSLDTSIVAPPGHYPR